MRLYLIFFLFLLFFVVINVAFLDNLRRLWNVGYPVVLLVINLDLLILFLVLAVFFRKFIKTYLSGSTKPLRRKLSTSLLLYIITPLLFLNLTTAMVLLQSTKTLVSGQLKEIAKSSEELSKLLREEENIRVKEYRELIGSVLKRGGDISGELRTLRVKRVERVNNCQEGSNEEFYFLCVEGYRVQMEREKRVQELTARINSTAKDLRNMVKGRDIIGGVYVYFLVLAGFVSFLSAIWFGNLIARHISLPLERLSHRTRDIASGNFDIGVEVPKTGDEVEELARSFLLMKEELRKLYERLKEERDLFEKLLNELPVGIVYMSTDGTIFQNQAYHMLKGKSNLRTVNLELERGKVYIYEDLEPVILSERFKTWQMAVKRIAHEIKNPLTPISLNLERLHRLLERGSLDREKASHIIQTLLSELERVKRVVNQFRDLSLEVEPNFENINLRELLLEMVKLYSDMNIEVQGNLQILGDRRLLRDMFFNLLNNSLEWGAREVLIKLGEERIEYRDNGKGIEEGKEELLFLPYYTESPQGMGLGLAIVKHIAELHGWDVKALPSKEGFHLLIEPSPRKGST
ncbi:MAG: HAMP domain-containing protein [Acidobacteria bacterium]|nr:MAG: HAMP domain-containing protein [Acidobacteriota bacterium]